MQTAQLAAGDVIHAGHRELLVLQVAPFETKIWVRDAGGNAGVLPEGVEFTRVGHITEPRFVLKF